MAMTHHNLERECKKECPESRSFAPSFLPQIPGSRRLSVCPANDSEPTKALDLTISKTRKRKDLAHGKDPLIILIVFVFASFDGKVR